LPDILKSADQGASFLCHAQQRKEAKENAGIPLNFGNYHFKVLLSKFASDICAYYPSY
jgi:hypothetical protein